MLSILYSAIFPWLFFLWFPLGFYLIFGVDVKPKLEDIDNNTPQVFKNKRMIAKNAAKMLILPVILCLVMFGYGLIDLIVCDFVTCEATYVESETGNFDGLERNYTFDSNGEIIKVKSLREKENANFLLNKGENYTVTYAKRTDMIVNIHGEEKIVGAEQPMNFYPIIVSLLIMLCGISGCVFGVWRIHKRK